MQDNNEGLINTPAVEGFKMEKAAVMGLLVKEIRANKSRIEFPKQTYAEIVSLKLALGKKDPETSGTRGFLIYEDGRLEELDNGTKLVEVPWGELGNAALAIEYRSLQQPTYRVYSAEKMRDVFGVSDSSF